MAISVCICTRNRADSLKRALESLTRLDHPSGIDWDVLVVDNGSTDATALTAMSFADLLTLKVVSETKAGLSQARNAALRGARGRHLIFIDDDVTVPPRWLTAYATGFAKYPDAGFFGGPIVARPEDAPQQWVSALREVMPGALSWLEPKLGECVLANDSSCLPWGANMAIRKSSLGGRTFDVELGRRPDSPTGSSEEMSLFHALLKSGVTGVWLPETRVDHHVGVERCSETYLRDYCRGVGRYKGRRKAAEGGSSRRWVLWRVRRRLRRRRQRYLTMNPSTPLVPRLTSLRDYSVLEGFYEGFTGALGKQEGSDQEWE